MIYEKTDILLVLALAIPLETVAAVDRTVATGLERHLRGRSAAIADDFVHLAVTTVGVLAVAAGATASGAAARFILEALVSKELLLGRRENELGATIAAS